MTPIQTVSYSYDTHGNKTKETISGTSGAVSVAQYSYDSKNRLLCTALRMNSATWGALPTSACTAATTGSAGPDRRSEEHTSELQSLMRISYAVFCLKKKNRLTT